MRPLRIFTVAYGAKYLDWMHRGLVRSLAWPKNRAAIQHAKWTIFGNMGALQPIYDIATKALPFQNIDLIEVPMAGNQINMLAAMLKIQNLCLLEKSQMLMAPPDTIFADGSISTLLEYGSQDGTCVAVPHPRVLPGIMDHLTDVPPTSGQLVGLALDKFPHKSWTMSDTRLDVSATMKGGVCWQKLDPNLWVVQHRLPTVYLANFNDDDRKYWLRPIRGAPPQFGQWDWEWPAELIEKERFRYIGSSDAAFICEITEDHKNGPSQTLVIHDERDKFFRDELHNRTNRMYLSAFRSEP